MTSVHRDARIGGDGAVVVAALGVAAVAGAGLPWLPASLLVAGLAGAVVVALVVARAVCAAYLVVGLTPLIAGIDRGSAIPFFRPSELLAVLAGIGLIAHHVVHRSPLRRRLAPTATDVTVVLLALASSIFPLLWLSMRGRAIQHDDILYAVQIWKYLGIYAIARFSVRTERDIRTCLWVAMVAAAVVAVIAILQALQLFGIVVLLQRYFTQYGYAQALAINRGGATLGLPIAVADLLVFNLAIAFGFLVRASDRRQRIALLGVSALFVAGTFAAGEVSGIVGLAIAGVLLTSLTGRRGYLVRAVPFVAVTAWLMQPVIQQRLSQVDPATGIPVSWSGRLENLQTFFWPKLFSGFNFALGVRPAARVATAKLATGYVWIESGYTWLLWTGGLPLLAAFAYFVVANIRRCLRLARRRADALAVLSLAVVVSLTVVAVCMVLDPHLTFRGSADLLFVLLGMTVVAQRIDRSEIAVRRALTAVSP